MRFFHGVIGIVLAFSCAQSVYAEAPAGWDELINKVVDQGQKQTWDGAVGYYLKKGTTFDRNKNRKVEYVSVVAAMGAPLSVSTVKEKWRKLNTKNWLVDQNIRILDNKGELIRLVHSKLVLSDAKNVVNVKELQTPAVTDPKVLKGLQQDVEMWNNLKVK